MPDGSRSCPLLTSNNSLDCPKSTRNAISRSLTDTYTVQSLPAGLPSELRFRLSVFLPFIPKDVYSDVARATRIDGETLEAISKVRSRPWEWTDNVELAEPASLLNTPVKNRGAVSLELFDAVSTGESVLPAGTEGEPWSFRDTLVADSATQRTGREALFRNDSSDWEGSDKDKNSPVETAVTRTSTIFGGSMPSPHLMESPSSIRGGHSASQHKPIDIMDVDANVAHSAGAAATGRGIKRKASGSSLAQEDVEARRVSSVAAKALPKKGRGKGKKK